MYLKHFALTHFPFDHTLAATALFAANAQAEAEVRLKHLLELRGIGLLTGEPGSGKTTLCRRLTDALHPAVLAAIKATCDAAHNHGIPVSLCGELGADPLALPILVGLGITSLSTSPSALARVKTALPKLEPARCRALAETALGLDSAAAVRSNSATIAGCGITPFSVPRPRNWLIGRRNLT